MHVKDPTQQRQGARGIRIHIWRFGFPLTVLSLVALVAAPVAWLCAQAVDQRDAATAIAPNSTRDTSYTDVLWLSSFIGVSAFNCAALIVTWFVIAGGRSVAHFVATENESHGFSTEMEYNKRKDSAASAYKKRRRIAARYESGNWVLFRRNFVLPACTVA